MILHMTRIRICGPRVLLDLALNVLQDLEVVHLVRPALPAAAAGVDREARGLQRVLEDVEAALAVVGASSARPVEPPSVPRAALFARRTRRKAEKVALAIAALEDERALLLRYREFFRAFEPLLGRQLAWPDAHAFYVVVRAGAADAVDKLRARLDEAVDHRVEVLARPLASGETAVLLLAPAAAASKIGALLATSGVEELPAPAGIGETNLLRALPVIEARLAAIPKELERLEADRRALAESAGRELAGLRAWLHDRLLVLEARGRAHAGRHVFVIEGWVPRPELAPLALRLGRELGPEVFVEEIATEPWSRGDAPVALANPPLFRPFEIITRALPLPRYGTIDPTPYVAVFFPMFFGLMVGDVGYGALLAILALVVRLRSKPKSRARPIAAVAGACALFTVVFGLVFGEAFGDLGRRALGMRALFAREEALVPFMGLTAALGVVHVLLGLVLAVAGRWRQGARREAIGRGVAALMVALTIMAILAALDFLPGRLFTPLAIAVLVAFPVLVLLEGVVAIVELISNFGQILSYARIMALGTASLMLAIVANEMVGAIGSVFLGVVFALLFHLVNFGIALMSPTIHALRLHYVEFFGRFFSPGGTAYEPLAHWHPGVQGS